MGVRSLLTFVVALSLSTALAAQEKVPGYDRFIESSNGRAAIFNGRQASLHGSTPYNGTYFWDTIQFLPGTVMYNGRYYENLQLNVDASIQELQAREEAGNIAVVLERPYVEFFTIGDHRFVNLQFSDPAAPEGYFEILQGNGVTVYRRVNKTLRFSVENVNGRYIGYEDPYYNYLLNEYYEFEEKFFIFKNGKLSRIGRRKALRLSNGK